MIDALKRSTKPITVVCLAPLTNMALALRLAPEVCQDHIKEIVWMGGAAFSGGNHKSWTEANAGYDPEAAEIVLSCGIPIRMYTWDVYVKVIHTTEMVSTIEKQATSSWSRLGYRLLDRDIKHWGVGEAMIGDAGAVAIVIDPKLCTTKHMNVRIELQGQHTRGMTVVDARGPVSEPDELKLPSNVHVVTGVDSSGILNL